MFVNPNFPTGPRESWHEATCTGSDYVNLNKESQKGKEKNDTVLDNEKKKEEAYDLFYQCVDLHSKGEKEKYFQDFLQMTGGEIENILATGTKEDMISLFRGYGIELNDGGAIAHGKFLDRQELVYVSILVRDDGVVFIVNDFNQIFMPDDTGGTYAHDQFLAASLDDNHPLNYQVKSNEKFVKSFRFVNKIKKKED